MIARGSPAPSCGASSGCCWPSCCSRARRCRSGTRPRWVPARCSSPRCPSWRGWPRRPSSRTLTRPCSSGCPHADRRAAGRNRGAGIHLLGHSVEPPGEGRLPHERSGDGALGARPPDRGALVQAGQVGPSYGLGLAATLAALAAVSVGGLRSLGTPSTWNRD
ncbi:hypothetical protein HMPREF0043_01592 [Actinobaculum sp. oral taxon 183 str. F0552]|nr:hypothetical protein HMPREF0043_01592 [Actinobaculum sp. oral taxon 183 str. F0552]